jgi:hypothetical protein
LDKIVELDESDWIKAHDELGIENFNKEFEKTFWNEYQFHYDKNKPKMPS